MHICQCEYMVFVTLTSRRLGFTFKKDKIKNFITTTNNKKNGYLACACRIAWRIRTKIR